MLRVLFVLQRILSTNSLQMTARFSFPCIMPGHLLMWFACLGVSTEASADSWMHPNDHFNTEGYQAFFAKCQATENWFQASMLSTLPNGRRAPLQAYKAPGDSGFYLHVDGDMRWVVHSSSPQENISVSHVEGFNGGSCDFVFDGHLHSLGGYGLWRRHFDLLRFHGGSQGWQLVATLGEAPAVRDKDASWVFFHDGKAYVFAETKEVMQTYGSAMYELYVLDVGSRKWTKVGLVDARLGQIKSTTILGSGALMLNEAGELAWLDFKNEQAVLLANREDVFADFGSWMPENGRMTFHNDSALYHIFDGDRQDMEIPWDEFGASLFIPMVSEKHLPSAEATVAGTALMGNDAQRPSSSQLVWRTLPWVLVLGLVVMVLRLMQRSPSGTPSRAGEGNTDTRLSPLTQKVLAQEGSQLDTEDLDELLDIAHLSSPETLRSQRAKLISRVNTEHRVLNGTDLIVRQRSANDRRRSVYAIGHVDVSDPD